MDTPDLIGQEVLEENVFENNDYIHVQVPGTVADKHLGSNIFHLQKSSVNLVICCTIT